MSNPEPNSASTLPRLNPVAVFAALGVESRLSMLKLLADGRTMSTGEVAAALGRKLDGTGKQLKVMSDAGVLEFLRGIDRRQAVFRIHAARLATPGFIDFGCCIVKLVQL